MAKNERPWNVSEPKLDAAQTPNTSKPKPENPPWWQRWRKLGNGRPEVGGAGDGQPVRSPEPEERRATRSGPQLCSLVVDHSGSMEEGTKAQEATRVLREVIQYAQYVNTADTTGKKVYFYTQIILFAERLQDSTDGMVRPPDEFVPEEAYTVRYGDSATKKDRLGNLTNFQLPLAHVYKTLNGPQGMTKARLDAGMPAPIVLFITDGKPNLPTDEDTARKLALQEADKLKALTLPAVQCYHPVREEIWYNQTQVRLITIGLGTGPELDQGLLEQLCTHVSYRGEDLPLYLHCPDVKDLRKIGARIVGTVTTAGQSSETLEEAIYALRHATGAQGQ